MGEHLDRRRQLKSRNSISELYLGLLLVVVSINPLQVPKTLPWLILPEEICLSFLPFVPL